MSYDSLLINECTVLENTGTVADAYGGITPVWTDVAGLTDIKCRHVSGKGREVKVGAEVVIIYDELFLQDIDITEQNRVLIGTENYNILSVVFRQDAVGGHHKHCYLEIVR